MPHRCDDQRRWGSAAPSRVCLPAFTGPRGFRSLELAVRLTAPTPIGNPRRGSSRENSADQEAASQHVISGGGQAAALVTYRVGIVDCPSADVTVTRRVKFPSDG